jgi:ABC-type transport system involved in multi-copper enzyme maturation permease subunit
VILAWPTDGQVDLSGFRSRHVFQLFGYGLLTAQLLLVPVFPATSIVRERTQGTLALLLNSPMTSVSIYFGKLLGVLGFVGLLLMMSIPAAAACYALGGISLTGDVLALYGVLTLVAVQYAALACW